MHERSSRRGVSARHLRVALFPAVLAALFPALLAALFVACAPAAPTDLPRTAQDAASDDAARPPFHAIEPMGGARLYVMGTVHAGPHEGWRFSPRIESAFADSDVLVLEVDLLNLDPERLGSAVADRAILEGGRRLPDVLTKETRALLDERDEMLTAAGLPALARNLYEPWFLTISLTELIAKGSRYSFEQGAENALLARLGDRPVVGLETIEEQLDLFDQLDPALQDLVLRDTLAHLESAAADLDRLIRAWRVADRVALLDEVRRGVDALPELEAFYVILMDERNERWVAPLEAMLRDPERAGQTIFVAVGALHVVGERGVPRLLERAGHTVTTLH